VPGHEDICKPEWSACNLFVMELSTSVIGGVMWSHFDELQCRGVRKLTALLVAGSSLYLEGMRQIRQHL